MRFRFKIIIIILVSIIILFLGFNIYKAIKDLDKKMKPKNMQIEDKIEYNEDGIILEYYIRPNEEQFNKLVQKLNSLTK